MGMDGTLIITGASRGIGLATAKLFLKRGYQIINLSRKPIPLAGAEHIPTDLTSAGWEREFAPRLHKLVKGKQHIALIHNAGLLAKDSMRSIRDEQLRLVMQVNLFAPMQLNRIVLPLMDNGSSIIYVSSTLGEKAIANACSYTVSKHALIGLMRSTCQDLAGEGIHTVCVCPGFTDTDMLREHVGNDAAVLDSLAATVTMGRLVAPEEIAETLYLCARSQVLNGAVIHANLGQIER